jgi:protein-S-isoprenylcysteine O-methyltransferase Ste14
MIIFKIIYWIGLITEIAIRAPYQKTWKSGVMTYQAKSPTERAMLALLGLVSFVIPLIYSVTGWLDFANYNLPVWAGWVGAVILAAAIWVFTLGHRDLKANWSPTLEIRKDQTLVTSGIYAHIRHPMYASQWLWVIAQALLLQNWLAGPLNFVFFIFFYLIRVKPEEKMMLDTFGDEYREYMNKTGGVIPKF